MIKKEKFIKYMSELKELDELEAQGNEILKKLCFDCEYVGLDRHRTLIINLLEETMNDTDRLISTYIYETGWEKGNNVDEFGEEFANINSIDKLYDFVLNWYKNKK